MKEIKFNGWVARDRLDDDYYPNMHLFRSKPMRQHEWRKKDECMWIDTLDGGKYGMTTYTLNELFPDLKWEDGPVPVEITVKPLVVEEPNTDTTVWVARDFNGKLYSYKTKPRRHDWERYWTEAEPKDTIYQRKGSDAYLEKIDDGLFPIMRWEDEPIKVDFNGKSTQKVWVARDWDGGLFSYRTKPWRQEIDRMWLDAPFYQDYKYDGSGCLEQLDNKLFPELEWDDEPIEVSYDRTKPGVDE